METPFIFGKLASGDDFTNRTEEIIRLKNNFMSGINTIMISPRRWGKSSLMQKVSRVVMQENKKIKIISIDLFNVRSEEDFYRKMAEQVIRGTTTKLQEIISFTKDFFKQWIPKISFSPDHFQEFSLGLNWSEVKKQPDEILDLPQQIAKSKGWKIIVCIDEFQNIGFYNDTVAFQKQLRSHWQQHHDVSYCLFGSKRHMLIQVFTSPSMPFYKFGDLMFIEKISTKDWEKYITERFHATGKEIAPEQSYRIATLVDNHPYYVQQLAQLCWLRCDNIMTGQVIDQSLDSLTLQLSLLFQNLTESLSTTQVNYLRAMINEEPRFSSKETIQKYQLGTSANVSRIKTALIDKEIIDTMQGTGVFLDPMFKIWLKKYYFLE
ncbi:MAG: ATPase [Bacteroidetes bacterium]|nr:ATPase [Bacteroidota bacterium]